MPRVPTAIRLDVAENLLHVTWQDGHQSSYDGGYIRFLCPCAGCRGHGPGQVPEPAWADCKDVRMRHVEAVGSYALKFVLTDAHATGIYSYDLLRKSCPSEVEGVGETGRPRDASE